MPAPGCAALTPHCVLQTQNKWRLIDFGSAALVDEMLPPSFTLRFAAPETVYFAHAYRQEQLNARDSIVEGVATPCLTRAMKSEDVWAIGVMAVRALVCTLC